MVPPRPASIAGRRNSRRAWAWSGPGRRWPPDDPASWGIFYDLPHLYSQSHFGSEPPWGSQINVIGRLSLATHWQNYPGGNFFPVSLSTNAPFPTGGTWVKDWQNYPGGNFFPVSLSTNAPFPTGGTWVNYPLDTRPTYVQQWNLSAQRQIGASLLLSASYVR